MSSGGSMRYQLAQERQRRIEEQLSRQRIEAAWKTAQRRRAAFRAEAAHLSQHLTVPALRSVAVGIQPDKQQVSDAVQENVRIADQLARARAAQARNAAAVLADGQGAGSRDLDAETRELDPTIAEPESLRAAVREARTASPQRRDMLLASIREFVRQLNEDAAGRREQAAELERLAMDAAGVTDPELDRLIDKAQDAHRRHEHVQFTPLYSRLEHARAREYQTAADTHVVEFFRAELQKLGVTMVEGARGLRANELAFSGPATDRTRGFTLAVENGNVWMRRVDFTGPGRALGADLASDYRADDAACSFIERLSAAAGQEGVLISSMHLEAPGARAPDQVKVDRVLEFPDDLEDEDEHQPLARETP